jgi:transposase
MAGVYKLDILESEAELQALLRQQKTVSGKERVQVLYLLKTQKAKTIKEVAELIGRNRGTVPEWLTKYRSGGREELVLKKVGGGRKRKTPQWAEKALEKKLQENEGMNSYRAKDRREFLLRVYSFKESVFSNLFRVSV